MCFDARTSINAFFLSAIGSTLLLTSKTQIKKLFGLVFWVVALVQLWEYFLWKDIGNEERNIMWSRLIHLTSLSVPIVGIFALQNAEVIVSKDIMKFIMLFVTTVMIIYIYIQLINAKSTKINKNGNLEWHYHKIPIINEFAGFIYVTTLCLSPLLLKNKRAGITFASAGIITAFMSKIKAKLSSSPLFVTSLWCYTASVVPLLSYILVP
jgi:hypothetical protein